MEIPNDVLDKLMAWNEQPHKNDQLLDERYVKSLLLSLVSMDDIEQLHVRSEVMEFINGEQCFTLGFTQNIRKTCIVL